MDTGDIALGFVIVLIVILILYKTGFIGKLWRKIKDWYNRRRGYRQAGGYDNLGSYSSYSSYYNRFGRW